jgi:hypothetical protein
MSLIILQVIEMQLNSLFPLGSIVGYCYDGMIYSWEISILFTRLLAYNKIYPIQKQNHKSICLLQKLLGYLKQ